MAPSMKAIIAVRTTSSVSMPASCMPTTSSKLKPYTRSITSTRLVTSRGCGPRDDVLVLVEVVEHRGDVEHVRRLHPEVELFDDRLGEQLDQRRRVGERGDGDAADEVRGEPRHHPQVLADQARHRGALHLDHDVLAGVQRGGVDLGDRGGRERRLVEPREHVLEAGAEVLLDGEAHFVERLGGHLVAALLELARPARRGTGPRRRR